MYTLKHYSHFSWDATKDLAWLSLTVLISTFGDSVTDKAGWVVTLLLVINSAVNPLVYTLRNNPVLLAEKED